RLAVALGVQQRERRVGGDRQERAVGGDDLLDHHRQVLVLGGQVRDAGPQVAQQRQQQLRVEEAQGVAERRAADALDREVLGGRGQLAQQLQRAGAAGQRVVEPV